MSPAAKRQRGNSDSFAGRVFHLRKQKGLTQEGLAAELKKRHPEMRVSGSAVHAWEKMDRSPVGIDMLHLAEFFGVEVIWLQFGITVSTKESDPADLVFKKLKMVSRDQLKIIDAMLNEMLQD